MGIREIATGSRDCKMAVPVPFPDDALLAECDFFCGGLMLCFLLE
jgi:hypothetical protein